MRFFPPVVLMAACLGAMFLLDRFCPVVEFLHGPWAYVGAVPLLAGLFFSGAAVIRLLRRRTTVEPFEEPTRLVTKGVYRTSRNPIYLGFALILVGVWVLLGSLSAVVPVVALIAVMDRVYIRFEERVLARKFGPEYQEYRRKTRRWI